MKRLVKLIIRLYVLNLMAQGLYALWTLARTDVGQTLATTPNTAPRGLQFEMVKDVDAYTVRHTIEDGIERVVYLPKQRKFRTPIVFQHGMWHGAWCWENWQARLAEWGWETHAHSLPGHAASPRQRPLWQCTLDYYLAFLKDEVDRATQDDIRPVLVGHSMGGALAQWYLKYVGDDLPAVALVAPWVAHSAMADGVPLIARQDPIGLFLTTLTWSTAPWVRSPHTAYSKLLSDQAPVRPLDLWARLTGESALVTMQHNPPFWVPPEAVTTPMLVMAGEQDTVVSVAGLKRTATHYGASFEHIPGDGHDLMMDAHEAETARVLHDWLVAQGIV
ncbi:MAG: alpha/beta hydrolase [Chloroflexota bacterium]